MLCKFILLLYTYKKIFENKFIYLTIILFQDGCNYVCRCDTEPEDSWNNITSNFDGGDRDDALLKP